MTFDEIIKMTEAGYRPAIIVLSNECFNQFCKDHPGYHDKFDQSIDALMVNGVDVRSMEWVDEYGKMFRRHGQMKSFMVAMQDIIGEKLFDIFK